MGCPNVTSTCCLLIKSDLYLTAMAPGMKPAPPGGLNISWRAPVGSGWSRKCAWSPPAYANRHVFARNDKELGCASFVAKP